MVSRYEQHRLCNIQGWWSWLSSCVQALEVREEENHAVSSASSSPTGEYIRYLKSREERIPRLTFTHSLQFNFLNTFNPLQHYGHSSTLSCLPEEGSGRTWAHCVPWGKLHNECSQLQFESELIIMIVFSKKKKKNNARQPHTLGERVWKRKINLFPSAKLLTSFQQQLIWLTLFQETAYFSSTILKFQFSLHWSQQ